MILKLRTEVNSHCGKDWGKKNLWKVTFCSGVLIRSHTLSTQGPFSSAPRQDPDPSGPYNVPSSREDDGSQENEV